MVFPLEAVELIKNLWRDRVNKVAQLPGNRPGKANGRMLFLSNKSRKEM